MIGFTTEPPAWAKLSPHLRERAEGYVQFVLYGKSYCVPLTPEMKKACGISRRGGNLEFKRGGESKFERMLMQVADALCLQVRDTVGAEVTGSLSRQLTEFLENKFDGAIGGVVERRLTAAMLPEHGANRE